MDFESGEKVFVRHKGQLFDGKVSEVDESKKKPFKVHYSNLLKRCEEWVAGAQLLKYTEENLQKQATLKQQKLAAGETGGGGGGGGAEGGVEGGEESDSGSGSDDGKEEEGGGGGDDGEGGDGEDTQKPPSRRGRGGRGRGSRGGKGSRGGRGANSISNSNSRGGKASSSSSAKNDKEGGDGGGGGGDDDDNDEDDDDEDPLTTKQAVQMSAAGRRGKALSEKGGNKERGGRVPTTPTNGGGGEKKEPRKRKPSLAASEGAASMAIDDSNDSDDPKAKRRASGRNASNPPARAPRGRTVSVELPAPLIRILVKDHNCINNEQKLLKLPRRPCVSLILDAFRKDPKGGGVECRDVMEGLRNYFDLTIGVCLLYSSERAQYNEVKNLPRPMSEVYGAEHLLRLIVKLPELLAHNTWGVAEKKVVHSKLVDFLNWMNKKRDNYFRDDAYFVADAEGVRRATAGTAASPTAPMATGSSDR